MIQVFYFVYNSFFADFNTKYFFISIYTRFVLCYCVEIVLKFEIAISLVALGQAGRRSSVIRPAEKVVVENSLHVVRVRIKAIF